jgi:predicted nucleic acid-binding protein
MLTPFHRAEWAHALAQHQFRGDLTLDAAQAFNAQFISDEAAGFFWAVVVPENAFDVCVELARRYGPRLAMRTLDSLHVACAVELKAERFWTFDERQAKLARTQGLRVA